MYTLENEERPYLWENGRLIDLNLFHPGDPYPVFFTAGGINNSGRSRFRTPRRLHTELLLTPSPRSMSPLYLFPPLEPSKRRLFCSRFGWVSIPSTIHRRLSAEG
jgi:hypothetical protein